MICDSHKCNSMQDVGMKIEVVCHLEVFRMAFGVGQNPSDLKVLGILSNSSDHSSHLQMTDDHSFHSNVRYKLWSVDLRLVFTGVYLLRNLLNTVS